jgi:hypothetical protein
MSDSSGGSSDAPEFWWHDTTGPGGGPSGGAAPPPTQTSSWSPPRPEADSPPDSPGIRRSGPGVPSAAPASQGGMSAAEVWRTGHLPGPPKRGRWRRRASAALTVVLLAASGAVVYLRLHHAPFGVTGVALTGQVKNGCAVDVTGRIATTGAAGTVSYEWLFTPQLTAPAPLSQTVTAGQNAVYVTAAVQGQGHGKLGQEVTLQVLGPGKASASAHVVISC